MNGWMGKIVKIDLGSMKQETVPVSAAMRRRYLGGRGLGVKLYSELCPAPTDPLAARQRPDLHDRAVDRNGDDLGPLPGRLALAPDRDHLRFELGRQFRRGSQGAGLDGLVIQGRADNPVYLYVHDGEIEVRDASAFLGAGHPADPEGDPGGDSGPKPRSPASARPERTGSFSPPS